MPFIIGCWTALAPALSVKRPIPSIVPTRNQLLFFYFMPRPSTYLPLLRRSVSPLYISFIIIAYVSFFIDIIMSCLCNIVATWTSVTIARRAVNATLSHYQVQVSKFAKELLVTQEYYKHDPNFNGLSATKSAQQLYEVHSDLLSLLLPVLAKTGFDGHFSEALGWWYMHAISKALQSSLHSTSPEVIVKQKKNDDSLCKSISFAVRLAVIASAKNLPSILIIFYHVIHAFSLPL